ncbi:MAG: caspase family protein [Gammaproteobacteria bacterium]|nr:caspase family protein [Gammaproteobacteria bacterium]
MQKIRQVIFASFFVLLATLSFSAQAANLIAIIASDTLDESIGQSVKQDFNHMRKEMQNVAKYTGLTLKEVLMQGKSTNPQLFLQQINSVKANSDDVIVFFFGGHGYRTKSKGSSPWPNLVFSQQDEGLQYEYVIYNLMQKHPRFLLTIADVCNSFIGEKSAPPIVATRSLRAVPSENKIRSNYQHLFLEEEGMINVTSAQIGEFASGSDNEGGAFTYAFLKSLKDETKNAPKASWKTLLDRAKTNVTNDSLRYAQSKDDIQHPYFELSVKND